MRALCTAIVSLMCVTCGQKGPLYLPDTETAATVVAFRSAATFETRRHVDTLFQSALHLAADHP